MYLTVNKNCVTSLWGLPQTHKPSDSIDVTDSYDLDEDDEQQRERGCIVVEYGKPVIACRGGEAQADQHTEQTHYTCKRSTAPTQFLTPFHIIL